MAAISDLLSAVRACPRRLADRAAYIKDDKIVTHREYYDQLELYSQLGFHLMPLPVT